MDLETLNKVPDCDFTALLTDIWPGGGWVVADVVDQRPFQSVRGLHQAMAEVVKNGSRRDQMNMLEAFQTAEMHDLIKARLEAIEGEPEEVEDIRRTFAAYESRFGYPFLPALDESEPLPNSETMAGKLDNDPDEERMIALRHISEQAHDRLEELLSRS